MPLLSQWIKKFDKPKLVEFFGSEQGKTIDNRFAAAILPKARR